MSEKRSVKILEPYITNGIPYIGLTEKKVRSRIMQVRNEIHSGTTVVKKCKKIHGPIAEEGTGLLQSSSSFYDQGAAKMQQMMVFS